MIDTIRNYHTEKALYIDSRRFGEHSNPRDSSVTPRNYLHEEDSDIRSRYDPDDFIELWNWSVQGEKKRQKKNPWAKIITRNEIKILKESEKAAAPVYLKVKRQIVLFMYSFIYLLRLGVCGYIGVNTLH